MVGYFPNVFTSRSHLMFRMNQFIVTIVRYYLCQILIGKNEEHLSKRVALVF